MLILLMGEGNFSFTLALCRRLEAASSSSLTSLTSLTSSLTSSSSSSSSSSSHVNNVTSHYIIATSYDSLSSITEKYKEAAYVLRELNKRANVLVLHDIDATRPLRTQLENAINCYDKSSSVSSNDDAFSYFSRSCSLTFDHIVFNFPHLGKEDAIAHASMIAHVMYSSKALFNTNTKDSSSDSCSRLYLTLTTQQAQLWKLHDMVTRNQLKIAEEVAFNPSDWPGYELRRHHVGKSFQNRVQDCVHYTIIDAVGSDRNKVDAFNLFRIPASSSSPSPSICDVKSICDNNDNNNAPNKKKKRKLSKASEDFKYCKLESVTEPYQCKECLRCFTSEQGVKTHINQVHILEVTGPSKNESNDIQCTECGKTFSNDDALFQHKKSKHEKITKADNDINTGSDDTVAVEGTVECDICGMEVLDEESLLEHMHSYRPVDSDQQLQCQNCGKLCRNERGLEQHRAFCE